MKSYQQLFAELKRRHVFKVAAIYGATAFVLLQGADLLVEALKLPLDFLTMLTVLVLFGFPFALILAWAFEITPDGVRRTESPTDEELAEIVDAPAPRRWPSGLLALGGVAALVFGAWWVGRQSAPPTDTAAGSVAAEDVAARLAMADVSADPRPSIAVLPFVNMSGEQQQEYFSDGMTEEILNTLARIRDLRVAARTSAFAYKGQSRDLREVGAELGVGYLLEGSVRKAGDQLRITAQLINASDGSHLWSEQYDRELADVFAIQTEIAEAIAKQLQVPLGLEGDDMLVTPTGDLAAYDLYLAGRRLMRERGASLSEAIRFFRAAVDRDSTWAPAWAALAEATEISIWYRVEYHDAGSLEAEIEARLRGAERAASRALELDPQNASALVALGSVQRDRGEWRASEDTYLRALTLDPDNAEAHQQYGELLGAIGRIAESVRALDRAVALDPAGVRITNLSFALDRDDRPAEALEVLEVGLRREPDVNFVVLWADAAYAHARSGQIERAAELLIRGVGAMGMPPWMDDVEATDAELRLVVRGIAENRLDLVPENLRPMIYPGILADMGEVDAALEVLRVGPHAWMPDIWMPAFDSLRARPEFQELMDSAGLGDATIQRTPAHERTRPLILGGTGE